LPFRSLFSSMSIDPTPNPSSSRQNLNAQDRHQNQHHRHAIEPAEDLYGYLLLATVPSWRNWPASGPSSRQSGFWNAGRAKGFESMGWEWRRRQQLAEMNRMTRGLRSWDGADKFWENKIMECMLDQKGFTIPGTDYQGWMIMSLVDLSILQTGGAISTYQSTFHGQS
jgi:hypothetical protein